MGEIILSLIAFIGIVVLSILLLGWQDYRKQKRHEESRTVQERIDKIRDFASSGAEDLLRQLELMEERDDANKAHLFWIEPVVGYTKRLLELASNAEARPEDAYALSEEANEYLREHKIKGVPVGDMAHKLGDLLEQRESEEIEASH